MDIKSQFESAGMKPDPKKDQFFLQDEEVIQKIVDLADIGFGDVVLEIGAGPGNLTRKLATKAKKVIAFEIDRQFKSLLASLPQNVELHLEDAWDFVQLHGKFRKRKVYNKIVSNLPYSFCEKLMHNLTFLVFDKVIFLVPTKFLKTLKLNPIFTSFLSFETKFKVNKDCFYPQPKTSSTVIEIYSLADPLTAKNPALFLRRHIYQHEGQKVKNSLKEGLIKYSRLAKEKTLTQKQAKQLIHDSGINLQLLDSTPSNNIYEEISRHFSTASS